jgi:predicted Ser/Thr protein kinase
VVPWVDLADSPDTDAGLSATLAGAGTTDTLHATQLAAPANQTAEPRAEPPPLRQIARFAVLRELGRGAMGVVYAGYDEELDRRVAIKLVDDGDPTSASLGSNQLLREAQALARLIHPNVVAVFEAGVHDSRVYLAMEYVHGVDLQQWLAAGPRRWREVAATFLQAGAGLLAAHKVGLVHRDFKPANVLVGDDGRVRVADFGLATPRGGVTHNRPVPEDIDLHRSRAARSQRLAATIAGPGALVGTPAYMAPEMLHGAPATAATDQYALCVALFEALYGHRPFAGDSLVALTYEALHAELPAAPPDPSVPPWLHALVLRGLSRDPARRFPDLAALLAELARDPEAERQRRRTRRLQLLAAVALTLVVVVGGVAIYRALVRDAHERRAGARLEVLREQLGELRRAGRDDEAAQVFASFTALTDNRGTAALGRAYREWGEAQADPDTAIDALAAGYVHARTRDDRLSSLRGLTLRLAARGDADNTAVALATLDAQAPELLADPELRQLRLATALTQRDLPAALAALADPESSEARVLSRLSRATRPRIDDLAPRVIDRALSLADLDSDGQPEVLAGAPGLGDGVVQILRGDTTLARQAELRLPPLTRPDGLQVPVKLTGAPYLLPGFVGAPRLLVMGENPGTDPFGQRILGILPLTPGAAPELVWTDSQTDPALGDLDRDGAPELYLATSTYSRHLRRLVRDPAGAWQQDAPHPGTDATGSDLLALTVADLDGDAVPELVVAAAGWNAYDLRVLRDDGHGGLDLVTRKTLGAVNGLTTVRADGRLRLAALKHRGYPSERRFPAGDHTGPPAGLYILELVHDTLETVQFVPASEGEDWSLPAAADLDGDGRDELVAADELHNRLLVFPRDESRFHDPLRIGGARPRLVADLDDDPEAEIVVFTPDGHTLVLGAGEALTPALPRALPEATPVREPIYDPAVAEAWRHAEDLAALGLPERAADELVAISRLSRDVQADMLLRAGELHAAAGKHALAAAHFTAAALRPDLAERALAGAIQAHRALREFTAAAALAETSAALPGLSAAARAQAQAQAGALRRAATVGQALALRFDRPLDPGWRIYDPLAVTRDPGTRALSLRTSSEQVLAELPLEWDGGSVELSVDFSLEHLDWATMLEVSVSQADDDDSWLALDLRSGGSTARPARRAAAVWGPRSETMGFQHELPPGFTGRVRAHFRHDVELGLVLVEVTPTGAPSVRMTLPSPMREALPTPPRGPLRLRLTSRTHQLQLIGRVQVHAIDLKGFRPGAWPTAADTDTDTARLITEGELGAALDRLSDATEGVRGLWRAHLLARLGQTDAATDALTLALRGTPDFTLTEAEVKETAPRANLRQLMLHDPDELHGVARRVLGPALDEIYILPVIAGLVMRPEVVRHHLSDLDPHPLAPPATPDPLVDQRHCEGLVLRAAAWRLAGRGDLARRDLEAAWQVLGDEARDFPLRDDLRRIVSRALLELGVAAGDAVAARRWLMTQLADSKMPEITLETWREQPDLQALLDADTWAEMARAAASPTAQRR